jgi:hypothetical protein
MLSPPSSHRSALAIEPRDHFANQSLLCFAHVGPASDDAAEERFWHGVETAGRFFMGEADVQKALVKLVLRRKG